MLRANREPRYADNSGNSDYSTGRLLAAHRRDRLITGHAPQRPVADGRFQRLADLYRHGSRGGIFDFGQQAVETALGRSFRG